MRKTILCFLLGVILTATAAIAAEGPALQPVPAQASADEPIDLAALLDAPPVTLQAPSAGELPWMAHSGGSVCSCGYNCFSNTCVCDGGNACCKSCCAAARCYECSTPGNPAPGCGFIGGGGGGNN